MSSPVSERGYARPALLAEIGWLDARLDARLDDPRVRIVAARGEREYAAGRVPPPVTFLPSDRSDH